MTPLIGIQSNDLVAVPRQVVSSGAAHNSQSQNNDFHWQDYTA
jgi:hypothetical protein